MSEVARCGSFSLPLSVFAASRVKRLYFLYIWSNIINSRMYIRIVAGCIY